MKKSLKWILSALYGLVMIEVIVMVSPFALYWYALYAPALQRLNHWRATAWLDAFFFPMRSSPTVPSSNLWWDLVLIVSAWVSSVSRSARRKFTVPDLSGGG